MHTSLCFSNKDIIYFPSLHQHVLRDSALVGQFTRVEPNEVGINRCRAACTPHNKNFDGNVAYKNFKNLGYPASFTDFMISKGYPLSNAANISISLHMRNRNNAIQEGLFSNSQGEQVTFHSIQGQEDCEHVNTTGDEFETNTMASDTATDAAMDAAMAQQRELLASNKAAETTMEQQREFLATPQPDKDNMVTESVVRETPTPSEVMQDSPTNSASKQQNNPKSQDKLDRKIPDLLSQGETTLVILGPLFITIHDTKTLIKNQMTTHS